MFEKNVLNKNYETECVVQKVWNRMLEKNVFMECLLKVWKECVLQKVWSRMLEKKKCCTESLKQNVLKSFCWMFIKSLKRMFELGWELRWVSPVKDEERVVAVAEVEEAGN